MVAGRRRLTIRTIMLLIAAVAGAFAIARIPLVWVLLDASISPLAAGLRYIWLCVGLVLVATLIRLPSERLIAFGWVLAGSLAINHFLPRLDLGKEPGLAGYFNLATVLAASLLWLAGWIMGKFAAYGRREEDSIGSGGWHW